MELATRHRNYEVANILKWRRAEENAVWSWWMVCLYPCEAVTRVLMVSQTQLAHDELQTTMIAETNCKRRRLECDCCAAEKPPPSMLLQVSLQTPCYTNVRIGLHLPPIPQQGCPGTTTLHLMNLPTHILDHSHPSQLSSPHHSPHPNGVTSPHNPFFPFPQAQELSRPDSYRPHRCSGSIAAPTAAAAALPPPWCYDLFPFLLIYFLFCLSLCAAPCLALFAFLCACFIAYLCVVLGHILHDT